MTNLLPRQISGPYKYPGLTNFWPNKSPGLWTLRDWKISGPDKYSDLKNFGPEKTLGLTKLWAWKTSLIPVIPCTCNFVPIATNWNQILDPQKLPSQLCPVTIATPRAIIQIVDIQTSKTLNQKIRNFATSTPLFTHFPCIVFPSSSFKFFTFHV